MKQTHEVRPAFTLMKLNDAISHFHMQMPRWLFSDPQYSALSLESKVTYTFLLNRFQLSRRNGWVNRHGEVYVIYTREDLAREMQISYLSVEPICCSVGFMPQFGRKEFFEIR